LTRPRSRWMERPWRRKRK